MNTQDMSIWISFIIMIYDIIALSPVVLCGCNDWWRYRRNMAEVMESEGEIRLPNLLSPLTLEGLKPDRKVCLARWSHVQWWLEGWQCAMWWGVMACHTHIYIHFCLHVYIYIESRVISVIDIFHPKNDRYQIDSTCWGSWGALSQ